MLSLRDPSAGYSDLVESGRPMAVGVLSSGSRAAGFLIEQGLLIRAARKGLTSCSLCGSTHKTDSADSSGDKYVCAHELGVSVSQEGAMWRADWDALQRFLRRELGIRGATRNLVAGHLTFLGRIGTPKASFPVWLTRGMLLAETRSRILSALENQPGRASGLVIAASRTSPMLILPNGSSLIWLGDVLDLAGDPPSVDSGAVYHRAPRATATQRRSGRPATPFDALNLFLQRIRRVQALHTLSAEAKALQAIEAGNELSNRPTRIERQIRDVFRAWEASGFDPTFQHDKNARY